MDRPSKFPIPTTTQRIMMIIGTTQKLTLHLLQPWSRFKGAPGVAFTKRQRARTLVNHWFEETTAFFQVLIRKTSRKPWIKNY